MSTRKIKDAKDLRDGFLIYFRGHAKATYMSDGSTVEDVINKIKVNGGGSGNSGNIMKEVTYSELVNLRDSSQLIPGMQYRITDFVTTCTSYVVLDWNMSLEATSAGHPFDIIVTALSNTQLDTSAKAIERKGDDYFSARGEDLSSWDLKYSLESYRMRFTEPHIFIPLFNFSIPWIKESEEIINGKNFIKFTSPDDTVDFKSIYVDSFENFSENNIFILSDNELVGIKAAFPDYADYLYEVKYLSESFIDSFRGEIFYMRDGNNNEADYDFKNIVYRGMYATEVPSGTYTFDLNGTDYSNNSDRVCYNKVMNNRIIDVIFNSKHNYLLPFTIFMNTSSSQYCNYNTVLGFLNIFSSNSFKNRLKDSVGNLFLHNFQGNNIELLRYAVFENGVQYNKIDRLNTCKISSYTRHCVFSGDNVNITFERYGESYTTGGFFNIRVNNCYNVTLKTSNPAQSYSNPVCDVEINNIEFENSKNNHVITIPTLKSDGHSTYFVTQKADKTIKISSFEDIENNKIVYVPNESSMPETPVEGVLYLIGEE